MQSRHANLTHYEAGARTCNTAILITGNGRSGTTILGKILASMRNVEYVYEPTMFWSLLLLISQLDESHFRLLFESCCYDELLIGQITGRAFNFNRHDDSRINLTKTSTEIDRRLATAWSKSMAATAAMNARLLIKLPDCTPCLAALRRLYPTMTFVVTQREPNAVIQSVKMKGWFKDDMLKRMDIYWPSQTVEFTTPFWVAPEDIENWRKWSELERAAYYYIRISDGAAGVEGVINVAYEQLVATPDKVVQRLAEQLGVEFGELTRPLINETYARSELAEDWVAQLPSDMRRKTCELWERLRLNAAS